MIEQEITECGLSDLSSMIGAVDENGIDVLELEQHAVKSHSFIKGGSGSGNFGHSGRPGEVGGSGQDSSGSVTDTPAFKKWFGSSKVVDEQGDPKVVYHGTASDFTEFRDDGKHTAYYFTDSPRIANEYTGQPGSQVMPVYLSIQNPYDGMQVSEARKLGHDGLISPLSDPDEHVYVVFKATQIKSAIGNSGAFDPKDPNITKSLKATPNFSGYVWSPYQRAYVPVSGKPVDTSATRKIVDEVRRLAAGRMNKLATDLKDGNETNLTQFSLDFKDEIKNLFTTTHVLARGGLDAMDSSDWGMLGQSLKEQYSYANSMVRDIENGLYGVKDSEGEVIIRDTGIPELGDAFVNRVDLYANSAWGAQGEFENVVRDREMALGSLERRVLDPSVKEHCSECLELAERGWQPPGLMPDIGDCECGPGDACSYEFENSELDDLAQAFGHPQIGVEGTEPTEQPPFTLYPDEKSLKGGQGSGNFNHEGRPGLIGGSGEGGAFAKLDLSKVNPDQPFYHGTSTEFTEFDKSKIRPEDYDAPFNGFWFSTDPETSPAMHDPTKIMEVRLDLKNPAPPSAINEARKEAERNFEELQKEGARSYGDATRMVLQANGYDGVIWEAPPKVDEKELKEKGETEFKDARGKWLMLKDEPINFQGKVIQNYELYDKPTGDITGYESVKDFTNSFDTTVVVFEPSQIKYIATHPGWRKAFLNAKSLPIQYLKSEHKFASTQLDIPEPYRARILDLASKIPGDLLAEDGRESQPHVTVLFGLHDEDPDAVQRLLTGEPPIELTIGNISVFSSTETGQDYDVLKLDVESEDLQRLHKLIADNLDNTQTHPEYHPHITLGYIKPGAGEQFVGKNSLTDSIIVINEVVFSDKDRGKTIIPLYAAKSWDESAHTRDSTGRFSDSGGAKIKPGEWEDVGGWGEKTISVVVNGSEVGDAQILDSHDSSLGIYNIRVDDDQQGKGYGKMLVKEIIKEAIQLGKTKITGESDSQQLRYILDKWLGQPTISGYAGMRGTPHEHFTEADVQNYLENELESVTVTHHIPAGLKLSDLKSFDESAHPRDNAGRFSEAGSAGEYEKLDSSLVPDKLYRGISQLAWREDNGLGPIGKYIYLTTTPSHAEMYASSWSRPMIVEIDKSKLDDSKWRIDPDDSGKLLQVAYEGKIPADAVKVYRSSEKSFDESQHPRDDHGRFSETGGIEVQKKPEWGDARTRLAINTPYGEAHVSMVDMGDHYRVTSSFVPDEVRGEGIGSSLYGKAIEIAKSEGKGEIRSDTSVSGAAAKVWEHLGAKEEKTDYGKQYILHLKSWNEEDHPRDDHGRFGAGGDRAERAKSTHIPMTKERWKVASDAEAKVAKIIGGEDTNNNKPFDIIKGNHAVEVKTILPGAKNPKITMHPESLERKLTEAATKGYTPSTIVVDMRSGSAVYYHRDAIGSFRLSAMEQVTAKQLKEKYQ